MANIPGFRAILTNRKDVAGADVGSLGLGAFAVLRNITGAPIAPGEYVLGSNLRVMYIDSLNANVQSAISPPGTWRNIAGISLAVDTSGMFQRTA